MISRRTVIEYALAWLKENPDAEPGEFLEALKKRFLGDVDYGRATAGASLVLQEGFLYGCLAAIVIAPLTHLWHRKRDPSQAQIRAWIDEVASEMKRLE